jgi:hypothetical protein
MTESALATRLLCFHKQNTSARTRFLRFGTSVLAPAPLPAGSETAPAGKVRPHPAISLRALAPLLGLPADQLKPVGDFAVDVVTPDGGVAVLLVEIATLDPPLSAAETMGASFIALTEARGLPPIELELLRQAYEILIG